LLSKSRNGVLSTFDASMFLNTYDIAWVHKTLVGQKKLITKGNFIWNFFSLYHPLRYVMYSLYETEYRIFNPIETTIRR
jgi:hypothetical protein